MITEWLELYIIALRVYDHREVRAVHYSHHRVVRAVMALRVY